MSSQVSLPFHKYGSIENLSSKELHNAQAHFPKIGSMEFVILEKAHGAHFSLQTNGKLVEAGKRNSTLTEKEEFFGHTVLIKKYSTGACAIFDRVCATFGSDRCVSIQIEGELIGGKYSHPDVQNFDIPRVQKGVEYCPGYELFVYDIKWFDGKKWSFIDYDICCELFKQNGFYYATPLARGTFNEVVNYNPCFQSLIPTLFGLPSLDKNYAEGVVIKPVIPAYFPNGSRLILKNKNDTFSETFKAKKVVIDLSDIPQHIVDIQVTMLDMITRNRLDSVISKIGQVTKKDFGKLIAGLAEDVIETFNRENGLKYINLEKNEKKLITKKLSPEFVRIVTEYFADLEEEEQGK